MVPHGFVFFSSYRARYTKLSQSKFEWIWIQYFTTLKNVCVLVSRVDSNKKNVWHTIVAQHDKIIFCNSCNCNDHGNHKVRQITVWCVFFSSVAIVCFKVDMFSFICLYVKRQIFLLKRMVRQNKRPYAIRNRNCVCEFIWIHFIQLWIMKFFVLLETHL